LSQKVIVNNKKVSVVIICYNNRNSIIKLLNQLLSQEFGDYIGEVLIIDNGKFRSIIDSELLNEKCRYFRLPLNLGFASACNFGAVVSVNNRLLFINPDCFFLEIYDLLELFTSECEVGFVGSTEGDKFWSNFSIIPSFKKFDLFYSVNQFDFKYGYFDGSFMLIKKDLFLKIGGFVDLFLYGEDLIFFRKLLKHSVRFKISGRGRTFTHLRGGSSNYRHEFLGNKLYAEMLFLRESNILYYYSYLIFRFSTLILLVLRDLFKFEMSISRYVSVNFNLVYTFLMSFLRLKVSSYHTSFCV